MLADTHTHTHTHTHGQLLYLRGVLPLLAASSAVQPLSTSTVCVCVDAAPLPPVSLVVLSECLGFRLGGWGVLGGPRQHRCPACTTVYIRLFPVHATLAYASVCVR
ncbi:hypothetical protein LMJF_23_1084 [Leishmania major strain Friedlin]|uniref:Uncharacterized protein n=1 Tax=Leishmania major TaxID=5664 RepID=E9ACS5_LEIMA|nr:hypothetical protein LMJF_23_1075 [Leishmania major strain Friedlin]XP_003721798.1 hypothetical protein LMJF_23_1084 [Leishmania major strain Friedlin]CAG9574308.1 small_hydrophilic_endoplasmic_reticulum-associated_protein_(sherp)_(SHERP2) [Leishmania major strain Friedlin]CAG9574312.1 small_hydrophilic_endoplasmic_reticulum-associated_protein_(sherp) [Leishmania major strain Friedlin]CBZ05834.1 hypothetical protein LMJF_23_1075 [Leishmania major strain Friedlin]CBZ05835.1 hypothetical prot|eukprot:XP_003721797.1 hypothetical protein LMJF_23_1075 [Leishmania major strain Friedlin]